MNVIEGDIRAVVGNSSEEIEVLVLAVLGVLHRATADSSLYTQIPPQLIHRELIHRKVFYLECLRRNQRQHNDK
jgi:hypothetical protein